MYRGNDFNENPADEIKVDLKFLGRLENLINSFPAEWKELKIDNSYLWICSLFTSKEIRGQNMGKILMNKIEEHAKSLSIDTLILDCFINEEEFLVKYYQGLGFTEKLRKEVVNPNRQGTTKTLVTTLTAINLQGKRQCVEE